MIFFFYYAVVRGINSRDFLLWGRQAAQETAAGATPALVGGKRAQETAACAKDSLGRSGRPAHGCAVMINDINSRLFRFLQFLRYGFFFLSLVHHTCFIKKRTISRHAGARAWQMCGVRAQDFFHVASSVR